MQSSPDLPPLDALTAMLAAARRGSLSAAADELSLTPGAVSRRIAAVEAWLGKPVFERHGRGVRLTKAGQHFAQEVERALASIADVGRDLRAPRRRIALRISVLPSFARLWLMQRLPALQGPQGDLAIQLLPEHRLADLSTREADVGIRYGIGPWPGVEAQLLMHEDVFAMASPPIARRLRQAGPTAVLEHPLLHDTDTRLWRHWFALAKVPYRPRAGELRFEDYDLALSAAEAGLGIALARAPLAADALRAGRLVRLPGPAFRNPKAMYVVTRPGDPRREVRLLVDRMRRLAGARHEPGSA
jgi:LysR family glycine cleavage system transcriptional activator